jgi:hypothetical protein
LSHRQMGNHGAWSQSRVLGGFIGRHPIPSED